MYAGPAGIRTPNQGIMSFFRIRLKNLLNLLKTITKQYREPARKENAPPLNLLGLAEPG
jgi:hypothetical protein